MSPEDLFDHAASVQKNAYVPYSNFPVAAVVRTAKDTCTPCGGCRQRLTEFAGPETVVHLCNADGLQETIPFSTLLPRAFGPRNLEG